MSYRERQPGRRRSSRAERQRLLIVTEGALSEPSYFGGIRQHYRRPSGLWRVEVGGGHPQAIVNRTAQVVADARREGDDFDQVWWVFDVEDPRPHDNLDAIIKEAERKGYRCAVSHPCFELWLILHFRMQTGAMSNVEARRQAQSCGCDYVDKHFDFDKLWPHRQRAITNAAELDRRQASTYPRLIDRNPWTSVHELVNELIRLGEIKG